VRIIRKAVGDEPVTMFNVGPGEMVMILGLAVVVLGPARLPGALRGAGKVIGEVRRISGAFQQELRNALEESEAKVADKGDDEDEDDLLEDDFLDDLLEDDERDQVIR